MSAQKSFAHLALQPRGGQIALEPHDRRLTASAITSLRAARNADLEARGANTGVRVTYNQSCGILHNRF